MTTTITIQDYRATFLTTSQVKFILTLCRKIIRHHLGLLRGRSELRLAYHHRALELQVTKLHAYLETIARKRAC